MLNGRSRDRARWSGNIVKDNRESQKPILAACSQEMQRAGVMFGLAETAHRKCMRFVHTEATAKIARTARWRDRMPPGAEWRFGLVRCTRGNCSHVPRFGADHSQYGNGQRGRCNLICGSVGERSSESDDATGSVLPAAIVSSNGPTHLGQRGGPFSRDLESKTRVRTPKLIRSDNGQEAVCWQFEL
jgi:hypothetical protein